MRSTSQKLARPPIAYGATRQSQWVERGKQSRCPARRQPAAIVSSKNAADKHQLSNLDADIEEQQRNRNRRRRQANFRQRTGKAEAVQQAEREATTTDIAASDCGALAAHRTISDAINMMLKAIDASTGGPGTCTQPSVAPASVRLCAAVNAVMVHNSRLVPCTNSTRARTNNR